MIESVSEIIPPGPLFKFLSLADGQVPCWRDRLTQLIEGKAYFPSPSQFNDPFDCLPRVIVPSTIEELKRKKNLLADQFKKYLPALEIDEISKNLDEAFESLPIDKIAEQLRNTARTTSRKMGVFSLTENIHSVLMGSHYASNHTGIAIKFDWRRQMRGGLMPLFKVRYEERRPSILSYLDERFEAQGDELVDALRTKAEFWRYEREWRSLAPDRAMKIVDFDPAVVDGIIVGANCSAEHEEWIRATVHARRLPVMRAFPNNDTFDISFRARRSDG